jgi:hypothetical protein
VIAVLTKYEALVAHVKDKYKGRPVSRNDVLKYANEQVFKPLKNIKNPPAAIVETHGVSFMNYNKNNNIKAL